MTRKREYIASEDISDLPPPSHRHPMSGEPIWDQHAVRAMLRAPVADEDDQPTAPDDDSIAECWVNASDCDGIAYDGPSFERGYRAALASAPVTDERAAFESRMMDNGRDISTADGSYIDDTVERDWQALASAPVACNCPGGNKPADLHAPNCPVRTAKATLIDPYDGGTWLANAPVAGEAVASMVSAKPLEPEFAKVLADNFYSLVLGSHAAPQASEAVRDAGIAASGAEPRDNSGCPSNSPGSEKQAADVVLPPLPEALALQPGQLGHTNQTLDYFARAAVLADRKNRAALSAQPGAQEDRDQ